MNTTQIDNNTVSPAGTDHPTEQPVHDHYDAFLDQVEQYCIRSRPTDPYHGIPKARATFMCNACLNIIEVPQGGSLVLIWPTGCPKERGGCGQSNFFQLLMVDPVVVPGAQHTPRGVC